MVLPTLVNLKYFSGVLTYRIAIVVLMGVFQLFATLSTTFWGQAFIGFFVDLTTMGIFKIILSILVLKNIQTAIRAKKNAREC